MKKYIISFLLLLAISSKPLSAISENTAGMAALSIGLVGGTISYACLHEIKEISPAFLSFVIGSIVSGISYLFFREMTPDRRFGRALDIVEDLNKYKIAAKAIEKQELLELLHKEFYDADLWLVKAATHLLVKIQSAEQALSLFDKVIQEGEKSLRQESKKLKTLAKKFLKNLKAAVITLKNSSEYAEQYALYQQKMLEEQKIQLQKEQIHAEYQKAQALKESAKAQRDIADVKTGRTAYVSSSAR